MLTYSRRGTDIERKYNWDGNSNRREPSWQDVYNRWLFFSSPFLTHFLNKRIFH